MDGNPTPHDGPAGAGAAGTGADGAGVPPRSDGTPGELDALVATLRQADRLMQQATRLAADVDGRRAVADEGMPVDTALQLHTGWTRGDLAMLLTASDVLDRLPAAMRLFEDGILTWGQVRALVAGTRRFDANQLAHLDEHLTEHHDQLAAMEPEQRSWCLDDAIADHTRLATLAARDDRAPEQDRLVLTPRLDGSGSGFFELHAESFHTVAERLTAEADAPQADPPPLAHGSDDVPRTTVVPRSTQLANALVRLCSRSSADLPMNAVRSTLIIDVDRITDRFAGELQTAIASRPPRIVRRAIDRIACDTTLDVVLRHGTDLLAANRYRSDVPEATRRAVAARDGGCRFPGCRAPVSWCDVHHVLERSRRGHHGLDNLVLLCRRHHTTVHRRGWRQHLHPDGRYRLARNGRSWTTLPRAGQQLSPPDARRSRDGPTGSAPSRAGPTGSAPSRAGPSDDLPF